MGDVMADELPGLEPMRDQPIAPGPGIAARGGQPIPLIVQGNGTSRA